MAKDYYSVLGVNRTSSQDDIKKAFRALARKYHPDSTTEDKKIAEEKFKEISEAYEVLSDQDKRRIYDQTGRVDFGQGRQDFTWQDFTHYSDFEDLFNRFFGGGGFGSDLFGGFRNQGPDLDLAVRLKVSLSDVYYGVSKSVKFRRNAQCDTCAGTGAKDGKLNVCKTCGGSGQQRYVQGQGFFKMVSVVTCKTCGGIGKIPVETCQRCKGSGVLTITDSLSVNLPKGAPDNLKIRFRGKGQSHSGRTGDLFVILNVLDEPGIVRRGEDLYVSREISFPEAALGTELEVPLFNEVVPVKIPSGTQPGEVVRIRGSGMPSMRGSTKGDLYVRASVVVPKHLTAREKELISELGETVQKKHSWFSK